MIIKCRNIERTMVKIRKWDDEKSTAWCLNVEIMKTQWWKHEIISSFHHRTLELSSTLYRYSYYRFFIIVLSLFQHHKFVNSTFHYRTVVFSASYYRVFIIVLLTFHYRTIAFLSDRRPHIMTMDESFRKYFTRT